MPVCSKCLVHGWLRSDIFLQVGGGLDSFTQCDATGISGMCSIPTDASLFYFRHMRPNGHQHRLVRHLEFQE